MSLYLVVWVHVRPERLGLSIRLRIRQSLGSSGLDSGLKSEDLIVIPLYCACMATTVTLNEETKDSLEEYKEAGGHSSFDSAVKYLLLKEGYEV